MRISNKQFCARLRKAKKTAVRLYPHHWCIYNACRSANVNLGIVAIFDKHGVWQHLSSNWVISKAKSPADIAAVFDNSIRALGEEP